MLQHLVVLSLLERKLVALVLICGAEPVLLFLDVAFDFGPLLVNLVVVHEHVVQLHFDRLRFDGVVVDFGHVLLERGLEEELSVADATSSAHTAVLLDLGQRVRLQLLELALLVRENPQLVRTSFASFVSAELAHMFVIAFELLVAHDAARLCGVLDARRLFQAEDSLRQLEADLLLSDHDLVCVSKHVFLDIDIVAVLLVRHGEELASGLLPRSIVVRRAQ